MLVNFYRLYFHLIGTSEPDQNIRFDFISVNFETGSDDVEHYVTGSN